MKKQILITAFLVAGLMTGCKQNPASSNEEDASIQGDNYTLFTSENRFGALQENRSDEVSEPFELVDVIRTDENGLNYLQIKITHQTCYPEPQIIWNGAVAESAPPQVFLFVQLQAEDKCPAGEEADKKTEVFKLNLHGLLGDEYTAKNAVIKVLNASNAHEDNDHYDEPVSSNGQ
ncbi:MAG: hypothetical protein WEB89_03290 [Balneolales bacterium]